MEVGVAGGRATASAKVGEESPDSAEQSARRKPGLGNRRLEPQRPRPGPHLSGQGSEKGNPPRCNPKHG